MRKTGFWAVLAAVLVLSACKGDGPGDEAKLADLAGTWVRVESNNTAYDGMKVRVSSDKGTVTDAAGSVFSVGDIKWQDITPSGAKTYDYMELGDDGNYYEAELTLVNDTVVEVAVVASGAGNVQRWVLEGTGSSNTALTETLPCDYFSTARTLKNGPAAIDYIVTCVMGIGAAVTIEAGTVIAFQEDAGLGILTNGSLKAVGTATSGIVFRGTTHTKGWWRGIYFDSNSINNQLDYVTIEDAGSNYVYCCEDPTSVRLHSGKLSIKRTTLRNGKGHGITARANGTFEAYEQVRVESHDEYPAYFDMARVGETDGTGSDYSGNGKNFFYIYEGTISEAATWPRANVPYLVTGSVIDVTAPLSIAAGTEVVFEENGGIGVYNQGTFALQGTAANPVIIRGKEAVKGYWRGIHIETNSLNNKIDYARISDAGSSYVYCCNDPATLYLKSGKCEVTNSTLSNGAGYGIFTGDNFSFAAYQSNTITTHDQTPLFITIGQLGELDGMGSSYSGNSADYIGVGASSLTAPTTWKKAQVPYLLEGEVYDITARLDVAAGVTAVWKENGGMGVYNGGILNIAGTAAERVVFRGLSDVQGYWRGIRTETNSADNRVAYTDVRNAGSSYVYCCNDPAGLYVHGGQLRVEYSHISYSGGCGIRVNSGATLNENNNTFDSNADSDICQ
ncbi:MAG: hypothetical protein OHK0039_47540 [Bacteroidia bacterium]